MSTCADCLHFKPHVGGYSGGCTKFKGQYKPTDAGCVMWALNPNPQPMPKKKPWLKNTDPTAPRPEPKPRSRAAQAKATKNGDEAERIFASACEAYRTEGKALLFIAPTGSAGVDFFGSLAGGRAVAVEVKSRAIARIGFDCIQANQAEELTELHRLGALAIVVVRLNAKSGPAWWALLWPEWVDMVRRAEAIGRSSAGEGLLDMFGRRCNLALPYDRPLWLEAALRVPMVGARPKIVEKSEE